MRHQNRVAKLGRTASHRKALMMNLATALIKHGKIKTTDAKAKELRRVVERLVTYGKRGTVHHRRLAYKVLNDRTTVKTLFDHIAPQYAERNGGYTRIIKLGFRDNDSAAVSLIEFVDYRMPGEKKASKTVKKATPAKKEKPEASKPVKGTKEKKSDSAAKSEKISEEPVVPEEIVEESETVEEPVAEEPAQADTETEETEKQPAE